MEHVKNGLAHYANSINESNPLYESCFDIYNCLDEHGKTIRKLSIVLSSVFVRNALPGDDPNSLGGAIRKTGTSMFGYFVRGLFELATKLTSAEWANLSISKRGHPILWSVKKLRLDNMYMDIYKRGKTKTETAPPKAQQT